MQEHKVIIIGAGFSGLCLGIKLELAGIDDYVILEKADDLGGTWRENTYPGAECDIPSALYSYSFEHNEKWEFKWSGQQQILKYQHDTAAKYRVDEHIHYQQELLTARFDEAAARWELTTRDGQQYRAQHLITAVGQLHHPSTPVFPDAERFQGEVFHSAKWDHSIDLQGKRVGVIGNAASAVQFVPEIAPLVEHMTVFQRSANWILPKMDRPYSRFEQWLSGKVPIITKLYRLNLWLKGELGIMPAIRGNRFSRWLLRRWSRRALHEAVADPELRAKLTPDYPIGAKRILFTDGWFPALARDNVHLDTSGIDRFTEQGVLRKDGIEEKFDVIIYGTGFKTNPFLAPMDITGRSGRTLREAWADGAQAYLGVSTHGFPNLHMMYGPNTNLGHNSIIIMIEAQAKYILAAINGMDQQHKRSMDIKGDTEQAYNEELQQRLKSLAFSEVEHSWYMDGGKITNNWAGGTREYMRRLRKVDWDCYILEA